MRSPAAALAALCRAAARPALVVVATLLASCTAASTELLPPVRLATLPGCGTDIDVYGADDTLFPSCGGFTAATPLPGGRFAPGSADYDASLAGRIQAALSADTELAARFGGRTFRVRACGSAGMTLSSLSPAAVADECGGPEAPVVEPAAADACRDQPGSLLLLLGAEPLDRCHGGGADTPRTDDAEGFAAHVSARLDALLALRRPSLALVGAASEWTPLPGADGAGEAACGWRRPDWVRGGLRAWRAHQPAEREVLLVPDLHDEFRARSRCCVTLGVPCEQPAWLVEPPPNGATTAPLRCTGAEAVAAHWIALVRSALASRRFACEE